MTLYRRKRKIQPLFLLLLIIIVLVCGGFFLVESILKNTLMAFAESQAKWTATEAVHTAILEETGGNTSYEDLIHIEKDNNNRIIFMEANIIKINRLSSSVALNIQRQYEKLKTEEFDIPLGQLTENMLLASYGPHVKFRLLPVGTVEVSPEDSFEHAGINQTRHKIDLDVKSKVEVVIPFMKTEVDINTKVPIADAIIVGEVPSTYLEFSTGEGLLGSKTLVK